MTTWTFFGQFLKSLLIYSEYSRHWFVNGNVFKDSPIRLDRSQCFPPALKQQGSAPSLKIRVCVSYTQYYM